MCWRSHVLNKHLPFIGQSSVIPNVCLHNKKTCFKRPHASRDRFSSVAWHVSYRSYFVSVTLKSRSQRVYWRTKLARNQHNRNVPEVNIPRLPGRIHIYCNFKEGGEKKKKLDNMTTSGSEESWRGGLFVDITQTIAFRIPANISHSC